MSPARKQPTSAAPAAAASKKKSQAATSAKPSKAGAKAGSPKAAAATASGQAKKPKRPPSAYSLFLKFEYANMKKANPALSFIDISKRLSDTWKELPVGEKERYRAESARIKEDMGAGAKKKGAAGAGGPSRPPTAYISFVKEMYPEVKSRYPHDKPTEITKKLGEMWSKMSETEKRGRRQKSEAEMVAFKEKSLSSLMGA